jgi:hypothetical protein
MEKEYNVYFDFTTVHGNRFVGRDGQMGMVAHGDFDDPPNIDAVADLCAAFVLKQKPKWKILMLTVKTITPIK